MDPRDVEAENRLLERLYAKTLQEKAELEKACEKKDALITSYAFTTESKAAYL